MCRSLQGLLGTVEQLGVDNSETLMLWGLAKARAIAGDGRAATLDELEGQRVRGAVIINLIETPKRKLYCIDLLTLSILLLVSRTPQTLDPLHPPTPLHPPK